MAGRREKMGAFYVEKNAWVSPTVGDWHVAVYPEGENEPYAVFHGKSPEEARSRAVQAIRGVEAVALLRGIVATGVVRGDRIEVTKPPYERALDFLDALLADIKEAS